MNVNTLRLTVRDMDEGWSCCGAPKSCKQRYLFGHPMLLRAAIVGQLMQTAKSMQLKKMQVGHAVANGGIMPRWNATRGGRSPAHSGL